MIEEKSMQIVPLTEKEDIEMAEEAGRLSWEKDCLIGEPGTVEPTVGQLGLTVPSDLCGPVGTAGSCAPGCCQEPLMTREEAKEDAERAIRVDLTAGVEFDTLEVNLAVEITEPGAMARLAELLGAPMSILLEAEKITNGQRQKDYGTALDNHERIARLWSSLLQNLGYDIDLSPEMVAIMMIAMKLARIQHAITDDGLIDVAGYANVISKMQAQRAERNQILAADVD